MNEMENARRYTYADYAAWPDDKRYELIDGIAYLLAAPSEDHQSVSSELLTQFHTFLRGKPCKVFHAPFDVCLFAEGDDDGTVVQPDLLVVCDSAKLDGKRCNGAPDLIVEILSSSTARIDKVLKLNRYQQAGVREYWIVDPDDETVTVNILDNGRYYNTAYDSTNIIPVHALKGCSINLKDVFME